MAEGGAARVAAIAAAWRKGTEAARAAAEAAKAEADKQATDKAKG